MYSLNKTLALLIFYFTFLLGGDCFADSKLPSLLYDINELVREFKSPYSLKLSDLKKNYRSVTRGNVVEFSSHEDVLCAFNNRPTDTVLSRLEYFHRPSGNDSVDVLRLYDCGGELRLQEELFIKGQARGPLSYDQWSEALLNPQLKEGEEHVHYKLSDGQGVILFELIGRRANASQVVYDLKINSQTFMLIRYDESPQESRVTYSFQGFEANYSFKNFYRKSQSFRHGRFSFQVIANQSTTFLSSRNIPLARNTFIRYFSSWALERGVRLVKNYVDFHLYFLPPTEVVSTGSGNSRFLEEIRLNINRLLNNLNLNLLELFLRNLLQAVEDGLIIDRRPSE